MRRFEFISKLGLQLLLVPRRRYGAGRRNVPRLDGQSGRDARVRRAEDGRNGREVVVGNGERVFTSAVRRRSINQP